MKSQPNPHTFDSKIICLPTWNLRATLISMFRFGGLGHLRPRLWATQNAGCWVAPTIRVTQKQHRIICFKLANQGLFSLVHWPDKRSRGTHTYDW